jgi:glutathione peroxidase
MRLPRLLLLIAAVVPASASAAGTCPALLDHTFSSLMDQPTALCQFQGKVVLVVNTASECGYTPQYEELEALYRRYRDRGLVVLGFPANDFGGQEPGSNGQIASFCEVNYGVSFPMFAKSSVAPGANPLYEVLAKRTGQRPQWNFHKYLIDRSGEKVLSFASAVEPGDRRLVAELERMLGAPSR